MLRQQRMRVARQLEGAEQVDLEDLAPLVLGVIVGGAGQVGTGVVDQDIQALTLVFHPIQHLAALFVVGDVADEGADIALGEFLGQFVARRLQRIAIAGHDQHRCAEPKQFPGDGPPDPGTAAGDQRKLPVQPPAMRIHVAFR